MTHQQVWIAKMTGHAPRGHPGTRAAAAHLQGVERAAVWQRRRRLSGPGQRLPGPGQDLAALQAADLRRPDRQRRGRLQRCREIGGQFYIQVTARPGHNLDELEKEIDEELARFLKEGPTPDGAGARANAVHGRASCAGSSALAGSAENPTGWRSTRFTPATRTATR